MLHVRTDKLCKTNKECSEFLQPWVNINWRCSLQTVSSSIHVELKLLSVTDRLRWQFSVLKSQNHLTLLKVVPGHATLSLGGSRCPGTHAPPGQCSSDAQRLQSNALFRGDAPMMSTTHPTKRIKERVTRLSTLLDRSVKSSSTFQFLKSVKLNSSLWPKVSYISAQMFSQARIYSQSS